MSFDTTYVASSIKIPTRYKLFVGVVNPKHITSIVGLYSDQVINKLKPEYGIDKAS